jgi:cytochrome c oxidase assembly protein Cox11
MKDKSLNKPQILMLLVFIFIGFVLMFFGTKNIYDIILKTKDYISVSGNFVGVNSCSADEDGETCTLKYQYIVGDEEYFVSTDYGSGVIPKIGTIKTIKYNPNNPSESVIDGFNYGGGLLFIGFIFAAIPFLLLFAKYTERNSSNKKEDVIKNKIFGVSIGLVFTIMGCASYYTLCAGGDSLSIAVAFQNAGLWLLIPMMFILVGPLVIYTSIFSEGKPVKAYSPIDIPFINSKTIPKIASIIQFVNYTVSLILSVFVLIILAPILFEKIDIFPKMLVLTALLFVVLIFIKSLINVIGYLFKNK